MQAADSDRLRAWTTLSELFLDTSFDAKDRSRIADQLRDSPYSKSELKHILRHEVAPAFAWNFASIAGEWARWDESEVEVLMAKSRRQRFGKDAANYMKSALVWPLVAGEWRRISALL